MRQDGRESFIFVQPGEVFSCELYISWPCLEQRARAPMSFKELDFKVGCGVGGRWSEGEV